MLSPTVIQDVPQVGRKNRNPQHSFQVAAKPYVLQPFMLAPVLPGDTLNNLLLQVRAVSDPIKNSLIGWWLEHYIFYVPHRALAGTAEYQAIMLDPTATITTNKSAFGFYPYYRYPGSVDWMPQIMDVVTKEFFRDEGEAIGGLPRQLVGNGDLLLAQINRSTWMDSIMSGPDFDAANSQADINVDGPDANTTIQASEVELAMRQWSMLRDMRLTDATYEDFLRTYGVKIPDREQVILPELVRYSREWTYPTNTVEPTTGVPSSAVSWSVAERADKKRFFREPGFLVGVTVSRPKVYVSKQAGAAAGMLDNVFSWLPAVLGNDPWASLKRYAAGTGPIPTAVESYIVDLKDLYLYGDQFMSFDFTGSALPNNLVALPSVAAAGSASKKYASNADIQGLFSGTKYEIRQDGVCSLNILSRVVDTSAKT